MRGYFPLVSPSHGPAAGDSPEGEDGRPHSSDPGQQAAQCCPLFVPTSALLSQAPASRAQVSCNVLVLRTISLSWSEFHGLGRPPFLSHMRGRMMYWLKEFREMHLNLDLSSTASYIGELSLSERQSTDF